MIEGKQNIAVLITCHNRKTKTLKCLKALYNCELPVGFSYDVFLVDDGSTDGTSFAVKEAFPETIIINGDRHLFWNRGMHLAWQTAIKTQKYDFYLWLNDDSFLFEYGLNELIESYMLTDKSSIITGLLCSEYDHSLTTYGGSTNGKILYPNNTLQSVELMNGNIVLIPESVFSKIGMLDPIFPHAIGDFDYGCRAVKAGISIYTTRKYIGTCEKNDTLPKWCLTTTPLLSRIKILYSPLGNAHPKYYFIYEKRHFGLLIALKHFITIHLRVLVPSLWS